MFKRLFGLKSNANREITEAVYATIVAAARQAEFYSHAQVPDTPLGRFEMLSLHVFLFLHRLRGASGAAGELAQEVTDLFIHDIDRSLRELGIGDMGIPKRVKKLARMFYGRAKAYGAALDEGDADALASAMRRNIRPENEDWREAGRLAQYTLRAYRHLADQPVELILKGKIDFLSAEGL